MLTSQTLYYLYITGIMPLKEFTIYMFGTVFLIIIPIMLHELGHFIYLKLVTKAKVRFGKNKIGVYIATDIDNLSFYQRIALRVWGVLFGLFFFIFFNDILLLILYVLGSRKDLIEIFTIMRGD